jgi:hypothetical protein
LKKIEFAVGSKGVVLATAAMSLSMLMLVQLSPAFAVTRSYPVYDNCDFVNTGSGSLGGCTPSNGDLRAYSTASGVGGSNVSVYMYGSAFSLASGQTATLSGISSSNVQATLVLVSGDTGNSVNVITYLDDPACANPWRCAYQGKSSQIYSARQNTVGTFTTSGAHTGPNVTYNISTTSSNFRVVAYADANTGGTHTSYADMRNSPNGAFAVSVTETN